MKYLAAIQARYSSTRLPGKILMDLCGKPVIERVIERVERSAFVDEVMVVTSINKEDIQTLHTVSALGRRVAAGSEDDVLDRYYQCARLLGPQYVIRVTADCPVFDSKLLDAAIARMGGADYTASLTNTLPDGTDIEVVKFSTLRRAWEQAKLASEREHVTLYIRNHPELFVLKDFVCPLGNMEGERWTLDEPADYEFLKKIYGHFGESDFYTEDILGYLDANPEIRRINGGITRNEGLRKSLENDRTVG
jgi:spore coat polysaccharide biosynthesis protein SpsF